MIFLQYHRSTWTLVAFLVVSLFAANAAAIEPHVTEVLVKKSRRVLYLLDGRTVVRSYHIALGTHPKGDKRKAGDGRTPEGIYTLDFKNPDSAYYKSIHISYPSPADIWIAKQSGVNPGGQIMIHGQKNGYQQFTRVNQRFDWTDGCIAVSDKAMDEIWKLVAVGTRIKIDP